MTLTGTGVGIRLRYTDNVGVRANTGLVYWDAGFVSTNGVCIGNRGGVTGDYSSVIMTGNAGSNHGSLLVGPTKHSFGTAAPTTGTWAKGDVTWNTAPAAGGAPGWVCTAAGTPGTWKGMANLAS